MFKNKKVKPVKDYVSDIRKECKYILDDENVMVLLENTNPEIDEYYMMAHYRLKDQNLNLIQSWPQDGYTIGTSPEDVISSHSLVLLQGGTEKMTHDIIHNALYNYQSGEMIIAPGIWDNINYLSSHITPSPVEINFLTEYNCFIAQFQLMSSQDECCYQSYYHPITREKKDWSGIVMDDPHFAILNMDGTIRDNKLLIGKDFFSIRSTVDLNEYSSLEEYKRKRLLILEEEKRKKKEEFDQVLKQNEQYANTYQNVVKKILKKI